MGSQSTVQPAAQRTPAGFTKLMRKLEGWELQHLREHVEELRIALEAMTAERDEAVRRAEWAEDCAEMWRTDAIREIEDSGQQVGLTISGHLVAVGVAA